MPWLPGRPGYRQGGQREGSQGHPLPKRALLPKFVGTAENPGKNRHIFFFSGLKIARARCLAHFESNNDEISVADIAVSVQEAVVGVITSKTVRAAQERGLQLCYLAGEQQPTPDCLNCWQHVASRRESLWWFRRSRRPRIPGQGCSPRRPAGGIWCGFVEPRLSYRFVVAGDEYCVAISWLENFLIKNVASAPYLEPMLHSHTGENAWCAMQ